MQGTVLHGWNCPMGSSLQVSYSGSQSCVSGPRHSSTSSHTFRRALNLNPVGQRLPGRERGVRSGLESSSSGMEVGRVGYSFVRLFAILFHFFVCGSSGNPPPPSAGALQAHTHTHTFNGTHASRFLNASDALVRPFRKVCT
jgi:hypothetical protein